MSDKPFAPTPNRIAQAHREGRFPRSSEASAVAAFAAALLAAAFVVPQLLADAAGAVAAATAGRSFSATTVRAVEVLLWSLVPALFATAGALAAGMLDGGLHVVAPSIDASRIDPASGIRRMFSRDALLAAGRAAGAFAASLAALAAIGRDAFAGVLERTSPAALAAFAGGLAMRACLAVLAIGALFALFDRWSAHRKWLEGLRMTRDELKRDVRESEGDPHTKGRRASFHRALVRGSIARVREASFVVANPDHIAVALKYAPPGVPVPEILVRACDEGAVRVKAIAKSHGIPIIEDVPLARALFAGGDAGEAIPRSLYVAVAQIVAGLAHEGVLK